MPPAGIPGICRAGLAVLVILLAGPVISRAGTGDEAESLVDSAEARALATEAPSRREEWVLIATPAGRALRTLVVRPATDAPAPTVIIVHENRGLTTWERGFADELVAAGYVAIVPDFLSGMGPNRGGTDSFESTGAAREAIAKLTSPQVMADLDTVVDFARQQSGSHGKIVVAGFCWGGGQAFRYAAADTNVDVALVFYGAAPNDDQLKQLTVPVYGFYGENDLGITGDVPKLKSRLKELDKNYQPVTYIGADHGFMRAGEASDAKPSDRKAREQALARLKEILSQL